MTMSFLWALFPMYDSTVVIIRSSAMNARHATIKPSPKILPR